jgi:hypothetical protein
LRDYITELLGTQTTTFDHDLCDRIAAMEKAYGKSKEGFWYRLWYGIGNAKDIAEAWLDLIPNEYGVSVIKAGMAVVFKVACSPLSKYILKLTCELTLARRQLKRKKRKGFQHVQDTPRSSS